MSGGQLKRSLYQYFISLCENSLENMKLNEETVFVKSPALVKRFFFLVRGPQIALDYIQSPLTSDAMPHIPG